VTTVLISLGALGASVTALIYTIISERRAKAAAQQSAAASDRAVEALRRSKEMHTAAHRRMCDQYRMMHDMGHPDPGFFVRQYENLKRMDEQLGTDYAADLPR
jgi:hypothetical protein